MDTNNIRVLLDLYFEGETTTKQEQELSAYFRNTQQIPADLMPYKGLFAAFDNTRQITSPVEPKSSVFTHKIFIRAAASISAAACIAIGVFVFAFNGDNSRAMVCYVDGVEVTDNKRAVAEAEKIFGSASEDIRIAMAQIEEFNRLF